MDLQRFQNYMNTAENFNLYNGLTFPVVEEGHCVCKVTLTQNGRNPQGVAHGSLLFAMCDAVTGVAAASTGRSMLTQSADIHYLRPVSEGVLTAESRVIRIGRRTGLIAAEVRDEENRLLCTGEFSVWFTGDDVVLPGDEGCTWH